MITFLHGTVVEKQPTRVVLDVGGVGYEVAIPLSSYDGLSSKGEVCRVLIHDYVREDTHDLYGFLSESERRMFLLLLGISGVGPKLALSALSGMSVKDITHAIVEGDVKRLSTISGVGRKTAERMVVELKDRIGSAEAVEAAAAAVVGDAGDGSPAARDAATALMSLGYKPDAARKMVTEAMRKAGSKDWTAEELIRRSLRG